jgi:hypothetical protein
MLLLVDDLEKVLDAGGERHRVKRAAEPALASVLRAFQRAEGSASRLALTSRYRFSLVDGERDWAETLAVLELGEFGARAARKLAMRQIRAAQSRDDARGMAPLAPAALPERLPLLERAEQLARGHPGLQDLLGAQVALRPDLTPKQAEKLLDAMETWLSSGAEDDQPLDLTIRRFIEALKLEEPLTLAGTPGRELLRGLTLFSLPVPEAALLMLPGANAAIVARLQDLGLLVPVEDPVNRRATALAPSAVASARLPLPTLDDVKMNLSCILPTLFEIWATRNIFNFDVGITDYELTRLALLIVSDFKSALIIINVCSRLAVRYLSVKENLRDAAKLGVRSIQIIRRSDYPIHPGLAIRTITSLFYKKTIFTYGAAEFIARIVILGDETFLDDEENGLFALYEGKNDKAKLIFDRIRRSYENNNKNSDAAYIRKVQENFFLN